MIVAAWSACIHFRIKFTWDFIDHAYCIKVLLKMEGENKPAIFTWKLENASHSPHKIGEFMKSLPFVVDSIHETKWQLCLYPRGHRNGSFVGLYLLRNMNSEGPSEVDIAYELAFLAKDGSVLKGNKVQIRLFPRGESFGYPEFVPRKEIFGAHRSVFLPRDTLTIRCRMWNPTLNVTSSLRFFARTIIGVEKRSFTWKIENFSSLESEQKRAYKIKSSESGNELLSLYLLVTGGLSCEEVIRFEMFLNDQSIKFFTLRLSIVYASGKKTESYRDEHWSDSLVNSKHFTLLLTKKHLLMKKSLYLPGDVLSLYWECAFTKGIEFEKIEDIQWRRSSSEKNFSDAEKEQKEKKKKRKKMKLCHFSYENLKSLYEESLLCDVNLKTNTGLFPAHKVILSTCSSVFKAMFASDMAEKNGDCVNIKDLSDDVIKRMLQYAYTGRIEDITWERATQLYAAADKYAILSLQKECSSFLISKLSPSNACEVLSLADLHADHDLKSSVQDFIITHDTDIIHSAEWKFLMQTNSKLAVETVCHQYT